MRFSLLFKKVSFALLAFFMVSMLQAQVPNQIIIANGGQFSSTNQVTLASWNPNTGNYFIFDSIPASSVQDVVVNGSTIYVGADSVIRRYENLVMTHEVIVPGVRQMALAQNQNHLVVTRGFPINTDYLQVYDHSDLSLISTIANVPGRCEGLAIVNDTAYVAVPGGFGNSVGHLVVVDLASLAVTVDFDLDSLGKGIGKVYHDASSNTIYALSSGGFGALTGYINSYQIGAVAPVSVATTFSVSGNGAGIMDSKLFGGFSGVFTAIDLPGLNLSSSPLVAGSWATSEIDRDNKIFYLTKTDFFSFGSLHRYDSTGAFMDSLTIGISPEAIGIDTRLFVGVENLFSDEIFIATFPNPATNQVTVDASRLKVAPIRIDLIDLQGRTILSKNQVSKMQEIDLSQVPAGQYFVRVHTKNGDYAKAIIKN